MVSSKLDQPTKSFNFYDVANQDKLKILAPIVTLQPTTCFKVKAFELYYKGQEAIQPKFIKVASDLSGFEVFTNERTDVGFYTLSVRVVASND